MDLKSIVGLLRAEREKREISQSKLGSMVGVSTNSIINWESGRKPPTLRHLIVWARSLGFRFVIIDAFGAQTRYALARDSAEAWDAYELRRLTGTLRDVREGSPGLTQREVACKAGVSRSSIRHWERLVTPPQAPGFVAWVSAVGCELALEKVWPARL